MNRHLKTLSSSARDLFDLAMLREGPTESIEGMIDEFQTEVEIEPAIALFGEVVQIFKKDKREESDQWLAPRIHSALRISRRDAADYRIWDYLALAIPEIREYVVWRWGGSEGEINNRDLIYSARRHAIGRLWWIAELTRNGSDYGPVQKAFTLQEMVIHLTDRDAFHNRPAALAYIRVLTEGNVGSPSRDKARTLARKLNHVLTTIVLDAIAPDPGPEVDATERWMHGRVDETEMFNEMPSGPDESQVPEEHIQAVERVLLRLASEDAPEVD